MGIIGERWRGGESKGREQKKMLSSTKSTEKKKYTYLLNYTRSIRQRQSLKVYRQINVFETNLSKQSLKSHQKKKMDNDVSPSQTL